jgi:chromosome segregation ATPase
MIRNLSIFTLLLVSLFVATLPASAADDKKGPRIKKCQDAAGKWHYGDSADEDCARSKVIELDTRGIQRREIAAPLTEAELKAREQNRERDEQARKLSEEQQRRDQQLLATYAIEDDIILTRDRKISDIEAQIRASQDTLKSLRTSLGRLQAQAAEEQRAGKQVSPQTAKTISNNEAQIAKHELHVEKMKKDQEAMRAQYQAELERFRELKRKPLPAVPAAATSAAPAQKK